jgi:hypothetical protein
VDYHLTISQDGVATVDHPVQLTAYTKRQSKGMIDVEDDEPTALPQTALKWSVAAAPDVATISDSGVFVAHRPGAYKVKVNYTDLQAETVVHVGAASAASSDEDTGTSFSVDTTGTKEPAPGTPSSGASVFTGTYKGTLGLSFGKQTAQVPWEFTVDAAGKVEGGFQHTWNPNAAIKATFKGSVADDGRMTTSGKATNSGTNGGAPFSSTGPITISGTIAGATFSGGFGSGVPVSFTAQRQ